VYTKLADRKWGDAIMENLTFGPNLDLASCVSNMPSADLAVYRDMFSSEYIHDVIYNHPERIQVLQPILDKLGFIHNIHFVFTIIFDNFWKICENRDNAYRYQIKRSLLNQTRNELSDIHPLSVAASLIGTDKVVVLLDCGDMDKKKAEPYSRQCAELLRDGIMQRTTFSVSIGVSKYCSSPSAAWKAYEQSFQALSLSFVYGYGNVLIYQKKGDISNTLKGGEAPIIAKRLSAAVSSHNTDLCKHHVDHLFRRLSIVAADENYAKSYVVLVLSEVTQYCIRLGMDANDLSQRLISVTQMAFQSGTISKLQEETSNFLKAIISTKDARTLFLSNQMSVAHAYIEQFHAENISLNDVAQLCGYSDAYFSRMFKKTFGKTYTEFLSECRIEHAKQLLRDRDMSASEISEAVGFHSFSYFCACFRDMTGETPGKYRLSSRRIP